MPLTDEECYVKLRAALLNEQFLPNERLVEMDLAQSLGAGRAAIRTALARLEQDGLISRTVHPTTPPRVDYALTKLGQSLLGPIDALVDWAQTHHDAIRAARRAYVPVQPAASL